MSVRVRVRVLVRVRVRVRVRVCMRGRRAEVSVVLGRVRDVVAAVCIGAGSGRLVRARLLVGTLVGLLELVCLALEWVVTSLSAMRY